ncbi:FAD-dependent oxidoreductase [Pedobacter frigoris]|uniref:FAD-dependent oxidoreductase n=1 Tax=Pedobacter frigoris TaxID=2571272 RepID=A0A4V5NZS8_9SPHI|nr:FAD-dependent oxidoreductase [Pedobacter frigoris]TKC09672.1 FAD-dependent oxidoreductase [Pedobacter frigoris]
MSRCSIFSCVPLFLLALLDPSAVAAKKPKERIVEVLVIGGTTSGTSAGIASARAGAKTLIVEESPWLGGMFSAQGVGAVDGNENLPSGLWKEFREKIVMHYGGEARVRTGWVSNTLFEPHVADSVFKAMAAAERDLTVVYGYHLYSILKEGKKISGAIFRNERKEQLIVRAKITIDATDIGESLKMAGAAYRLGMDARDQTHEKGAPDQANDIVQDLTWVAILKDYGSGADRTIPKPRDYKAAEFHGCCSETVDKIKIDCDYMLQYGRMPKNKYMINWPKYGNDIYLQVVEMSRSKRNKALKKAKEQTLRFVYYIQDELGFKHLGLADDEFDTADLLAYKPYHREGRRLRGISYLTYNDVENPYQQEEYLYKTGISVGDYPVDHHHDKNPAAPKVGFDPVPSFNIPLGALIPETIDGLIVSDKAISVSNLINGSTRLQPVVLLTGQAAGTLAALAVKENKEPREVSIRMVQSSLLKNKAYIMPLYDVPVLDPDFESIQKITATGILKTKGESWKWANRTWFYPDSNITVAEFTEGLHSFDSRAEVVVQQRLLTMREAFSMITSISDHKVTPVGLEYSDEPISKRKLALLLIDFLNPFAKEINHQGKYY